MTSWIFLVGGKELLCPSSQKMKDSLQWAESREELEGGVYYFDAIVQLANNNQ